MRVIGHINPYSEHQGWFSVIVRHRKEGEQVLRSVVSGTHAVLTRGQQIKRENRKAVALPSTENCRALHFPIQPCATAFKDVDLSGKSTKASQQNTHLRIC